MSTPVHAEEPETNADRRKRNKEVYEAVLGAVDHNSGHMQPPLAKRTSVLGHVHAAGYGSYSLDECQKAITAACSNGDLFRARDANDDVRLGINDSQKLREKIRTNLSRVEEPRRDVIGLANKRIQQLRGDDDE